MKKVIETIRDPYEVQKIAFNLVKSCRAEILGVFSTANAFHRQIRMGALELLKEASKTKETKIRILTPVDDRIYELSQKMFRQLQGIKTRHIEPLLQTRVSILIVDRRFSLVVELKDDTKDNSYEAMGLATYSNSKSTVLSYATIFESLWNQNELYEQLKVHDKIQRDFINIAAHE